MYRLAIVCFSCLIQVLSKSLCGIDNVRKGSIKESRTRIETYPWLGFLYYPHRNKRYTTVVVLVTKQFVLGTATEIDKLPKEDFRERARVILGQNCSGTSIGVRDYSYHSDYSALTNSALALVQLETDLLRLKLRPICPPPSHFNNPQFYAMVLSDNCKRSYITVHKMKYVELDTCKSFYENSGLNLDSMWPKHTACARSVATGTCIWRSGAILAVKYWGRWRLLGFGIYGPGCESPARFLDYGMYHKWVEHQVINMGKPAITKMEQNQIILRRIPSNIQRFGPCDAGEKLEELYSDVLQINSKSGKMFYNVTLRDNIDYTCLILKSEYAKPKPVKPKIALRDWCKKKYCNSVSSQVRPFFLEILYHYEMWFNLKAYGKETKGIDPRKIFNVQNKKKKFPTIISYNMVREKIRMENYTIVHWYSIKPYKGWWFWGK